VQPDESVSDYIVIARSQRYRAPEINYSFLKRYPKLLFIGVEQEWKEMQQMLPGIDYRPVNDFLEMARIIGGSKLFIGNQSFPFAIAEALKTKRLLEVYWRAPNVIPEGSNGYDFYFQPQFEKLAERLFEES
jgi:ADP-heptose:LPS heptosyltransferase